jgi:uncharacterized protein
MKIAIISDVHDNTVNLQKTLDYCKIRKIKTIICCGDLASEETLDFLNDNFSGTIHYVYGNMDNEYLRKFSSEEKYKNTFIYKNFGEMEMGGKKTAFTHFPDEAKELCKTRKYNFVFYGHSHKPWEEIIGDCKILNPGNVAGTFYPPTFAVWETESDKFELIRIHELQ